MKLIHLTDTHFVPRGETLYGGDPRAVLEAAVADINKHHSDADLVCITGDLTHWGETEAFESLAEVLSPLTPPVQLLLGNHDNRPVFTACFPDQKCDESGFVQSVRKTSQGHLIFLDTYLEGSHAGWFCDKRRVWLSEQLKGAEEAGAPAFLFMHHPPFKIGLAPLDKISLQEPEAFAAVIAPYADRIRHLFFGHIHRPLSGSWKGIPVSSLRGMNHQCWFDLESEDILSGSFEPPAYAVVLIADDTVVIHTHDFLDGSKKFDIRNSPFDDWAVRYSHA
ncbi:phosphodiesterase [Pelagibius sp. Alg239-R121]|uniref:phosphodiesterase n=1 Tax=Pelagibius sp. Alg239-R121 TaxID=2993448 RepID=UPI0024A63F0D|nr:phosphodiesterase [Pelagibius sp. Alg239-R121]